MYIADLHIHSKYSRATSRDGDAPHLDLWARRKGIGLLGTGDFTHPAWRAELTEMLEEAEEGFYRLRDEYRLPCETAGDTPRFVVSGEISTIYKRGGKTRKVHQCHPPAGAGSRRSPLPPAGGHRQSPFRRTAHSGAGQPRPAGNHAGLLPAGHFHSRPYLDAALFALRGVFGFFHAGRMLWRPVRPYPRAGNRPFLRPAHEPPPFHAGPLPSGLQLRRAFPRQAGPRGQRAGGRAFLPRAAARHWKPARALHGTVEFYPEEGKYHLDGHRRCQCCLEPAETAALGGRCPVCGRALTVGVLSRVEQLADRAGGPLPAAQAL